MVVSRTLRKSGVELVFVAGIPSDLRMSWKKMSMSEEAALASSVRSCCLSRCLGLLDDADDAEDVEPVEVVPVEEVELD